MVINTPEIMSTVEHLTADGLNKAGMIVLRDAKINCPVQTGNLRRSITLDKATERDLEISVFTNVEYAPYVEVGTENMDAKPFLLPALEKNRDAVMACLTNLF